ncbi:hypothetical protein EXIGLDRAFT_43467 [Exidia glandulosa HHB12029]|uniref:Uncharacterized protein n=1 Tax=Exidia glandulosa HHB12029 TaxID=1314781 RepID=A0A165IK36_EXIGL|nr:hypothetical protein EXIGLDRAFT_43467 [Exidia glandulosa HHB12029]
MLGRRSLQHVCFMCAHLGRQITTHPASRSAAAAVHRVTEHANALAGTSNVQHHIAVEPSSAGALPESSASGLEPVVDDGSPDASTSQPKKTTKSRGKKKKNSNELPEDAPPPPPRAPGRSETFLRSLEDTPQDPTLEDLDRFKPTAWPDQLSSQEYETAWNSAVDSVCKSFSRDQLRAMAAEIAHDVPLPERKIACARLVIERSWGWKNPADIAREEKMRFKVHARSYNLAPSELFLLLGHGGRDLLRLSVELQVRVSVVPAADALSLRVEGLTAALNNMDAEIKAMKETVCAEELSDPFAGGIPHDLIQRISKLSNAFLEPIGNGKVLISAKRAVDVATAKRLVIRAAAIDLRESSIPTLFHLPPQELGLAFQRKYALYPFLSPRTLLWTMGTGGAFRARRVSEWLGGDSDYTEMQGLYKGKVVNDEGESVDLMSRLFDMVPKLAPGAQRLITARTGNLLFTSRTSTAQRASLSTPLEDPAFFHDVLRWVHNNTGDYKSTFVQDLPAALLTAPPSPSTLMNRLIYRAPDVAFGVRTESFKTIELDLVVPEMGVQDMEQQVMPEMNLDLAQCRIGLEATIDVLLPDRPSDVRITVYDYATRTLDSTPSELKEYASALKIFFEDPNVAQPSPPLHVTFGETQYTLDMSASVRRSVEKFEPPKGYDWGLPPTVAITESNVDLEGNQKGATCEIRCDDPHTALGWKTFLAHCDRLTMRLPRPTPNIADDNVPDIDSPDFKPVF